MDKTKLIFRVDQKLWITPVQGEKYFVWKTSTPLKDIGKIEKNSILIFHRLSPYSLGNRQPLEFIVFRPGSAKNPENIADFFEEEITNLTKENVLRLLDSEEIEEMTITLSATGEIFIKKFKDESFDSPVFLPKDIYVVIGMREFNRTNGKLGIGDKIHLQHIIDYYFKAIGRSDISPPL